MKNYVSQTEEGKKYSFTRREIRQQLRLSKTQQHRFMQDLVDLEYLQIKGGYSNKGLLYQVQFWDDNQGLRKTLQNELEKQLNQL